MVWLASPYHLPAAGMIDETVGLAAETLSASSCSDQSASNYRFHTRSNTMDYSKQSASNPFMIALVCEESCQCISLLRIPLLTKGKTLPLTSSV